MAQLELSASNVVYFRVDGLSIIDPAKKFEAVLPPAGDISTALIDLTGVQVPNSYPLKLYAGNEWGEIELDYILNANLPSDFKVVLE